MEDTCLGQLSDDEKQIIRLLKTGDQLGIVRLLHLTGSKFKGGLMKRFYGRLNSQDVEDIICDFFVDMCEDPKKLLLNFKPEKGSLSAFAFKKVREKATRHIMDKAASDTMLFDVQSPNGKILLEISSYHEYKLERNNRDSVRSTEQLQLMSDANKAFAKLSPLEKQVLREDVWDGGKADAEELSHALDTTVDTIYVIRHRGHRKFKNYLKALNYDTETLEKIQ